jgi:hypothetical protein
MPPAIVDSSRLRGGLRKLPARSRFRLQRAFAIAVTLVVAFISAALLVDAKGLDGATESAVCNAVLRLGLST